MTDTTPHPPSGASSPLDRAAAAGPMDWDDNADAASTPSGEDGEDSSVTSMDDADGHDHMSSIYGPPPELRQERSTE